MIEVLGTRGRETTQVGPGKQGEEQRGVDGDLAEREVEALELLGNAPGEGRRHKLQRREGVQGIRPVAAAMKRRWGNMRRE